MKDFAPFVFPEITEDDISWVCQAMGLPDGAFDKNRKDALKEPTSIDVAACPGSGKTTLLVAKLAILARKWTSTGRGICVLSHTNVARNEIEKKLGATAEGQALLRYPHFVGTIHGFVDRFLGIPYLRWKGWGVLVDDDLCFDRVEDQIRYVQGFSKTFKNRYRQISYQNQREFFKLRLLYNNGNVEIHPQCNADHLGLFPIGTTLDDISNFQTKLKKSASQEGLHAFNDMFAYGHRLLDIFPAAKQQLVDRFPVLLIDEAQDNSDLQAKILHRVFVDGETGTICQRFGDANQAIYHSLSSHDAPTTWLFPNNNIKRDISDSYRFGQSIADLATPLAVEPQTLKGQGPDQSKASADVDGQNAIFLFDNNARSQVLPAFSKHLRAVFPPDDLENGSFVAVGGKHRLPDNDKNKPNSVCDYWTSYAPEQASSGPRPDCFIGYVQAGRAKRDKDENGNLHHMIETIAAGILEASRRAGGKTNMHHKKSRYIREVLAENREALKNYSEFLRRFAVDGESLNKQAWDDEWKHKISIVVETVFDGEGTYQEPEVFFNWPVGQVNSQGKAMDSTVYHDGEQLPTIHMGSIHSVKGETHTGVLVLETFIRAFLMKALKKWILGNAGTQKQRDSQSSKLKLHYVAMTRPTHLLCLALPVETFEEKEIATLQSLGWRVGIVAAGGEVSWADAKCE